MRLHLQTQKTDHITIQPHPMVRGTMDTTHHNFSQESTSTATHPKHQHPSTHPFVIWQEWRPRSAGWTNRFQLRSHSGCLNLRMTGGPDVLSKHIVSLFVYGNRNLLWKMLMQGFFLENNTQNQWLLSKLPWFSSRNIKMCIWAKHKVFQLHVSLQSHQWVKHFIAEFPNCIFKRC